jgi:glucose/arabinose dehydrogenase
MRSSTAAAALFVALVAGCTESARLPFASGVGPQPTLPPPRSRLIPTVNIAPAVGWPTGMKPRAAAGLSVVMFASGLDHPRWLYVLPNGDVLVAETNAPPKPEDAVGIKGFVMKKVMQRAGAMAPSANRISLLRDADGDGVAEVKTVLVACLLANMARGTAVRTAAIG